VPVSTDKASRSIEIRAPRARVLAAIRDVGSQPEWVREVRTAEVLETDAEDRPSRARFTASTPVGTDEYTLVYAHRPDGMSWSLVDGRLQTGQEASYRLRSLDPDHTEVTFELEISHNLPLPGFVRRKVIQGLVQSTLSGLKAHVET
jgi:uncharacterized membrane protein